MTGWMWTDGKMGGQGSFERKGCICGRASDLLKDNKIQDNNMFHCIAKYVTWIQVT